MARMSAIICVIIFLSSQAIGQTIGVKIGTLYDPNYREFVTQRLEVSFSKPILQDVDVTIATGLLTAMARVNSGYAIPLTGGLKYTFLHSVVAPYCGLEYGGILFVRRNSHSRMGPEFKAGLGIQYPLQDKLLLDVSTKLLMEDGFAYELMAGIRFRL